MAPAGSAAALCGRISCQLCLHGSPNANVQRQKHQQAASAAANWHQVSRGWCPHGKHTPQKQASTVCTTGAGLSVPGALIVERSRLHVGKSKTGKAFCGKMPAGRTRHARPRHCQLGESQESDQRQAQHTDAGGAQQGLGDVISYHCKHIQTYT